MHRLSSRWLVALFAALVLALAACEAEEEEEPEEPADPTEEPDEDDPEDDDAVDDEDEAIEEEDEAVDEEEADLTPADGETIVDLLSERGEAPEVDEDAEEPEEPAEPTYATLLEAVEAAELVELLDSEGPFTVFAPTDDAFALQPEDTLEELINDPERLSALLGYHVVEGEVGSEDLADDDEFETVSGETIRVVENEAGDLTIQGVPIVEADLEASNGVVHGIAAVMLPPAE